MTISKPIDMQRLHTRVKQRALADEMHSSLVSDECIRQAIMYSIKLMELEGQNREKKRDPIFRIDYASVKDKKIGFTENPELSSLETILTPFGIPNKIYVVMQLGVRKDIDYEVQDIDMILDLEHLNYLNCKGTYQKNPNILRFSASYDVSKIIDGGISVTNNPRNIPTIASYNKVNVPFITEYEEEYIVVYASDRIASDFRLTPPTNNSQEKMNVAMLLRLERKRIDETTPISAVLI